MRFGTIKSDKVVADLLAEVFGRDVGQATVEWLGECPTGPNRWYVAFDSDKPVAMCGMLPVIVEICDRRHLGVLYNHCGTIPGYRGRNIFTDLSGYAVDDMKVELAIEVHNSNAAPGPCMAGWKKLGTLELLAGETTRAWKEICQYDCRDFRYFPTFKRMPVTGHPRFMVVRGEAIMRWRYRKPDQTYHQCVFSDQRHAIWKVHEDHKQVLETNDWETVTNLGGDVDVWAFRGTKVSSYLKGLGFKPVFERDFIVKTKLEMDSDLNTSRFELTDHNSF